jgi:hypothetical protein
MVRVITSCSSVGPVTPAPVDRSRSCARWLFVTAAAFYLATGSGLIHPSDGVVMFNVTESLSHGRLDIEQLPAWPGFGVTTVRDTQTGRARSYAKYGIALSLLGVPLDWLASAAEPLATAADWRLLSEAAKPHLLYYEVDRRTFPRALRAFFVSGTNAFVVAITLSILFLLLVDLGFDLRLALASAAIVGVATPLWQAARDHFSEPLGALGVVGCLLFARRSAWRRAGAFLGLAIIAKPAHLMLAAPALLLVWGVADKHTPLVRAARLAAGVAPLIILVLVYNAARFGNPLETGYGAEVHRWENPFLDGFLGLLVSPGRGFLLFAPLWILAVAAARELWRRCPVESLFALGVFASLLVTYAKWHMWEGGWCWGPRYLLPAVPLLGLPVAATLERARDSKTTRVLAAVVVLVAAAVSWSGTRVDANDFSTVIGEQWKAQQEEARERGFDTPWKALRWDPRASPLRRYWTFEPAGNWLLPEAVRSPGEILAVLLGAAVVCLLAGGRLCILVHRRPGSAASASGP